MRGYMDGEWLDWSGFGFLCVAPYTPFSRVSGDWLCFECLSLLVLKVVGRRLYSPIEYCC